MFFESIHSAYPVIKETIPQSALGYNTNNKYAQFPPLMSDGRAVTASWQPESVINAGIIKSNGIKSNWEYRRYLTTHSKEVMKYNFLEASNDVGYYKRPIDLPNIQTDVVSGLNGIPYRFNSIADKTKPFSYTTSDMKELYLSRQELDARKVSPVITQEQLQQLR